MSFSGPNYLEAAQGRRGTRQGEKVPEVCKELNAAEQTYYLWQKKVGGMQPEMVKSLEALEKTNLG